MIPSLYNSLILLLCSFSVVLNAQTASDFGYIGYSLSSFGDEESAVYDTASTQANVSTTVPAPDVFLNATVHVGLINITVDGIQAKVNLDAQVLQLLKFSAGVDASIDRVSLAIENVDAHVVLEARLANLVTMITDVLESIDLNPALVGLGQGLSTILNPTSTSTATALPSTTSMANKLEPRSFMLSQNILYSINDYSGNTHTNRILAQNGSIIDQSIDNHAHVSSEKIVGSYLTDMSFNGHNKSATYSGQPVRELEYVYAPFPGLTVVSAIYTNAAGTVVSAQVRSEAAGGGSSTVSSP